MGFSACLCGSTTEVEEFVPEHQEELLQRAPAATAAVMATSAPVVLAALPGSIEGSGAVLKKPPAASPTEPRRAGSPSAARDVLQAAATAVSLAGVASPPAEERPARSRSWAALVIQRSWTDCRRTTLVHAALRFVEEGLTSAWSRSVAFEELAMALQRDSMLLATAGLMARLVLLRDRGGRQLCAVGSGEDEAAAYTDSIAEPSRILLSAFVVSSHPEVVFADTAIASCNQVLSTSEHDLHSTADSLLVAFEALVDAVVRDSPLEWPMSRFRSLWVAYHAQFTEWKRSSANYLTDELVAAYLELEAARQSAETAPYSADEDAEADGGGEGGEDGDADASAVATEECVEEIVHRQAQIRSEIVRLGGPAAEKQLQEALEQYATAQQAANAQLAHEIILNPELQLLPTRDPEMLHVRGLASTKFWDSVQQEAQRASPGDQPQLTPSSRKVIALLSELRDGLLGLTTNFQFSDEVCDVLDLDLLQQQMQHGALDNETVVRLLEFVVAKIIELDAPAYEDDTRAWLVSVVSSLHADKAEFSVVMVDVFTWLFAKLEQIRVGVANYHLRSLSAVLRLHGVEYEQATFAHAVFKGDARLSRTLRWLRATMQEESINSDSLRQSGNLESVPKLGVLQLCLSTRALSSEGCPETLRMDLVRLLCFQGEIQRLAVVAAVILVLQQVLTLQGFGFVGKLLVGEDGNGGLQESLLQALQRPEFNVAALIDHVVDIADTTVSAMNPDAEAAAPVEASAELELYKVDTSLLRNMLETTVCEDSKVYSMVRKTMGAELRSYMISREFRESPLRSGGLEPVIPRIKVLAQGVSSLADHNYSVHGPRYHRLLTQIGGSA